ncbi:unnamed protein product [Symbiodinium natans]|uniref:Uncharacterized protein n=1 Tax=Symbiodinium natans TaxID=878477 RepID=A0A812QW30_9DINO|nr:unnamed protein product [Symbiodinium natans]
MFHMLCQGYGYEARADVVAEPAFLTYPRPDLGSPAKNQAFEVAGHEERGGHTWYQMKCSLLAPRSVPALRWQVDRRLSSLREELHDRIKDALGSSYATQFGKTPFALKGGLPGTTARLNAWFGSMAEVVNRGDAKPSVVALLLLFLEAPEQAEQPETAAEPTQEAPRSSPESAYVRAAPVQVGAEDRTPTSDLSPVAHEGHVSEEEIEISLED